MKNSSFLTKLKKEEALKLVDTSDEISKSYLTKSGKCTGITILNFNKRTEKKNIEVHLPIEVEAIS